MFVCIVNELNHFKQKVHLLVVRHCSTVGAVMAENFDAPCLPMLRPP